MPQRHVFSYIVLSSVTIAVAIPGAALAAERYFGLVVAGWGLFTDVVARVWVGGASAPRRG